MRNEDIMYGPRPESGHCKMEIGRRAKQFAPFAALKGYEEAIEEKREVMLAGTGQGSCKEETKQLE